MLTDTGVAQAADLPERAIDLLERLRRERIRVHAVTNAAAQAFTANLLLAAGAVPSLTVAVEEVPAFTARAGALLVNLGTLDAERRAAIPAAIEAARGAGVPWVLDPVFVEASPLRLALARQCLAGRPALLRCNGPEFTALTQRPPSPGALMDAARRFGTVIALTGEVDRVCDGDRVITIRNGHPFMGRVTAMGCAATALVAAFAAIEPDGLTAGAAGLIVIGVAGEIAGAGARGPGSFVPHLLDALHNLTAAELRQRARVS